MVTIEKVQTKKQQRDFLEFPLKLYEGNPYFVPPLYGDEKKIFDKNYAYYDTGEAVYFNAYRDGRMVGRISGILQRASNELRGEKRVRFTRFDAIDDTAVSDALFEAVESWAMEKGMDTVCGPLGFSDLEREGLLVEGFDQLATFEEQYNFEYYQRLIEHRGYIKEVDWLESKIYPPKGEPPYGKMAEVVMRRNRLHEGKGRNINQILKKYGDKIFNLIDEGYRELYGTVPLTENVRKMIISNFKLLLNLNYIHIVLDENEEVVCFGFCLPSIAKAVQRSKGRLTPGAILRILKAIHRPEIVDLGLIAVSPKYANRGVAVLSLDGFSRMLMQKGIAFAETNLNLEENYNIRNQWKRFETVEHKRRRSYVKKLVVKG